MQLLLLLIIFYVLLLLSFRLFVPYLGFKRVPIPRVLPEDIRQVIERLDKDSSNNEMYLRKAYDYVTTHYYGSRVKTVTHFWYAFKNPLTSKDGFMYCMQQNYLLRTLLIGSGRFTEDDIKIFVRPFNFFIHQYLRVKLNPKWVNVDPWVRSVGIPFGSKHPFIG